MSTAAVVRKYIGCFTSLVSVRPFYASVTIRTVLEHLCFGVVCLSVCLSVHLVNTIFHKPLVEISPRLQYSCTWGQ